MSKSLTAAAMLAALPEVLRNDVTMHAMAAAAAGAIEELRNAVQRIIIYPGISSLPEELCDILAEDLKVDWYDYNFSLADKRSVLEAAMYVHRHIGTIGAVETAVSAIYQDSRVDEWYEYSGDPYHFKVLIDSTYQNTDPVKYASVVQSIRLYKNLRSVLDSVEYYDIGGKAVFYVLAANCAQSFTDSGSAAVV